MQKPIPEKPENFYRSVGSFKNKTEQTLVLSLEMLCEEIHLWPNQEIELFVENDERYFPMFFHYHSDTIQIFPNYGFPKWYFRFNGKMYEAGYNPNLSELE